MAGARRRRVLAAPLAIVLALAMLSVAMGVPVARAQSEADAPHPAHIHSGTCADLGEIVAPLGQCDVADRRGSVRRRGGHSQSRRARPPSISRSAISLAAPHAVNIHQSADAIQVYIACGDIGGRVVDGQLTIGLQELNGSGYLRRGRARH